MVIPDSFKELFKSFTVFWCLLLKELFLVTYEGHEVTLFVHYKTEKEKHNLHKTRNTKRLTRTHHTKKNRFVRKTTLQALPLSNIFSEIRSLIPKAFHLQPLPVLLFPMDWATAASSFPRPGLGTGGWSVHTVQVPPGLKTWKVEAGVVPASHCSRALPRCPWASP